MHKFHELPEVIGTRTFLTVVYIATVIGYFLTGTYVAGLNPLGSLVLGLVTMPAYLLVCGVVLYAAKEPETEDDS